MFKDSPLQKVERLEHETTWTLKSDLPKANTGGCMASIDEATVLLIGGSNLNPSTVSDIFRKGYIDLP